MNRGRIVEGDCVEFQAFELLAFRAGQGGGGGAGLVLGDELFEVFFLRQDARVDPFFVFAAFHLVLAMGIDLSGVHRQLSARQREWRVEDRVEPGQDAIDVSRRLKAFAEDDELVSGDARNRVAWSHRRGHSLRDRHQQLVARLVAVLVVDLLEVIEIDEEERHRCLRAHSAL